MTDRELLELAAKAAGIQDGNWLCDGSYWVGAYDGGCEWNPLTDDGDALRLAVKLGFYVTVFARLDPPDVWVGYKIGADGRNAIEELGYDPYAATRRAIVRAAAEIGKGMK